MSKYVNKEVENIAYAKDPNYVKHMPRADRRRAGIQGTGKDLFFNELLKVHPKMQKHIVAMYDRDTNFRLNNSAGINTRNTMPAFRRRSSGRVAFIRNAYTLMLKHKAEVLIEDFKRKLEELNTGVPYIVNINKIAPGVAYSARLNTPIQHKSGIQRFVSFALNGSMFKTVLLKQK